MKVSANFKKRLPIIMIVVVAIIGAFTLRDFLSFETLTQNNERLSNFRDENLFITAIIFIGIYFMIVTFSLPGALLATLTGGFLFGVFLGVVFNIIAASLGAITVFMATKIGFGTEMAQKIQKDGGPAKTLLISLKENEWSALFIMRLVPAVPFFIANLLPAFVGTSLWRFAITTVLGITPGTLVYTSVGTGLESAFAQGTKPDLSIIFQPIIIGPILGLVALSALPIIFKIPKRGKQNDRS